MTNWRPSSTKRFDTDSPKTGEPTLFKLATLHCIRHDILRAVYLCFFTIARLTFIADLVCYACEMNKYLKHDDCWLKANLETPRVA